MSGFQGTPVPWSVVIDDDGNPLSGRPSVQAADKYDCAIVHWDGFVQEYWQSARGSKEIHANAHLIATAPELLASLQEALTDGGIPGWEDRAQVAIAKALNQ